MIEPARRSTGPRCATASPARSSGLSTRQGTRRIWSSRRPSRRSPCRSSSPAADAPSCSEEPKMALPNDLKEKACLVTGASRGIGAAVARALGHCGSHVAVHYRTGRDEAAAVARDIEQTGGKALLLQGDIAEPGVVERLVSETHAAFGGLDILINNAGDLIARHPVADTTDEFFD